jgi:hypothetical protein
MERRLAAILSADVVGYSRLMAADEEDMLAQLMPAGQCADTGAPNGQQRISFTSHCAKPEK